MVLTSMLMAKMAANGGAVRSSSRMNSRMTRWPPGTKAWAQRLIKRRLSSRRRWIGRDQFVGRLARADPELTALLAEIAPDTTDDLPLA